MIRPCALLIALLAAAPAPAQEYVEREIHFRYSHILPAGNLYDGGFGVSGTVRNWQWGRLGWAFSLGLDSMDFKPDSPVAAGVSGGLRADGTAGYIPVQGSLLLRAIDAEPLRLNLEAGLRYMVGVTSADVIVDAGGRTVRQPIDVADSITALAAAHLEYRRQPGANAIVLSAGFQQDLVQGEFSVAESTLGDVELSGAFIALGMSFDL